MSLRIPRRILHRYQFTSSRLLNTTTPSPQQRHAFRTPIRPYPTSPQKTPPTDLVIPLPSYALTAFVPPNFSPYTNIHPPPHIVKLRNSAKLARRMLNLACSFAKPGVTTDEIDTIVHEAILNEGAYPSPLNYCGFPKSLCSSVNEVICHGIPDSRPLEHGDIVSFDVSVYLKGFHGDNCATVIVGDDDSDVDDEAKRLVSCAEQCLDEAVSVCKPHGCLSDIGNKVQEVVDSYGFDTVKQYRGHGIGQEFHTAPFVKHFANDDRMELLPGMVFTIEPMITEGSAECKEWDDGWTVVTVDKGRAAQFEHMVLITETGVEVLTVDEEEEKDKC